MAGRGARTHEYKKSNRGGARPVQYIYAHPKADRAAQEAVLERDDYGCRITTLALFGDTTQPLPQSERRCRGRLEVHHRARLEDRGTDDTANLVTLCERHHALTHQVMRAIVRADGRRWPPS
jgi:hypothetical protein